MAVAIDEIKKLREATGAGILDCRKALEETGSDFEKAVDFLREKALAAAKKRSKREASEGYVELYSHGDGRVGVMVEVNCQTDFVGRSDDFRNFAHEIALQITASAPLFVKEEDIPAEMLERKQIFATARAKEEGKPDKIIPKIVEGYLKKFKDDVVLLRQPYIRDESITINDLLAQNIASMGENIIIRRFARFELGELSAQEPESED
jgi:elongation factor Ts